MLKMEEWDFETREKTKMLPEKLRKTQDGKLSYVPDHPSFQPRSRNVIGVKVLFYCN